MSASPGQVSLLRTLFEPAHPDDRVTWAEVVGLLAGLLVALGLVPQVYRVWSLKDAQEISLSFNLLSLIGTILWLAYGLLLHLLSVIVWNGVNVVLLVMLLVVKLMYGMPGGIREHVEQTSEDEKRGRSEHSSQTRLSRTTHANLPPQKRWPLGTRFQH